MELLVEFLVAVDGARHGLKKKIHHTELSPAF
jgi:hypothetical protein